MDAITLDHLERVRTAVLKKDSAASIARWITEHTTLGGLPYSYKDHEYQQKIMSDQSRDVVTIKCAQVGISEVSVRMALALVNILRPYTVAYTLHTADFAAKFARNRVDPVISGSKTMLRNVHPSNNNASQKQFGESFLYMLGASPGSEPISIPVDHIIHDEVDFSDQEVLGKYLSRLGHSKWKRTTKFSTPTVPGYGIHLAFTNSRRHYNFCKCHHCNFQFIPSYYDHVKVPGYLGDLRELNKQRLTRVRFQDAQLHCPSCGRVPSLQPEHREWVCENPDENFVAAGYQVTPFDAPNVIKIPYLIEVAPSFTRVQDFVNNSLGLAMEDSESTLTREDFRDVFVVADAPSAVQYVMGIDVGGIYHVCVSAVDAWGDMFVVHTEQVPMGKFRVRYVELCKQFRITCTVIDSMPHAETVMALQAQDPNLYASVYVKQKSVLTHTVIERKEIKEDGQEFIRQVNINRSFALDGYMEHMRSGHIKIKSSGEDEVIVVHHMSMKRVKTFDNDSGEMRFSWQKTDGNDHYHHTFLYCWIASKIRGISKTLIQLPTFQMFTFPVTGF